MSGTGSNPLVVQGTLNRIRGSVSWPAFSAFNVTASYLGKEGIDLTFTGEATLYINTMTGAVTSPEPYLMVDMTIHLLRTQALAASFQSLQLTNTLMGDCTLRTDAASPGVAIYQFANTAIRGVRALKVNGTDSGYAVMVGGIWYNNSSLFV